MAMFVIELIYKTTLAEIDAAMAAHVKFLKKYYAAGNFLVRGERYPVTAASSWPSARAGSRLKASPARTRSTSGASPTSSHRVQGEPTRGQQSRSGSRVDRD